MRAFWAYLCHPVIAVALIIPTAVCGYEMYQRPSRHAELIKFMELAGEATSREEVERLFTRLNSPMLSLRKSSDTRWRVVPPIEFTANNWILYIDFANGQLTALRIRTSDGLHDHPNDAPPDVIFENRR